MTLMAAGKNVQFAAKHLREDLRKLTKWCAKWRIKLLSWKNQSHHILQVLSRQKSRTHCKTVWWETQSLSSSEISRNHFRLQIHVLETLGGNPGTLQHQVSPNQTFSQQKMGTQPVHHIKNLWIMCPDNFRIWLLFDHNNIGHNHQQNSTAPEQIYQACPAFTKIH